MSKGLLIFGLGELSELAHYYFSQHAGRRVEAFTADPAYLAEDRFAGLPVLAFDEARRRYPPESHDLFVAIGYSNHNSGRKRVYLEARTLGYTLASFVHESAIVARNVRVGANMMLRERAVVGPYVSLGEDIIVGVHAALSHHVRVDSHVWLGSGSLICGGVALGECCFVGAGATVRDKVTVGPRCIVGAGALIMSDCAADGVYAALPTPRRGSA
jgi:sugar O-acyltransferase (sialic acid O-acetyltransferase NeuD family)